MYKIEVETDRYRLFECYVSLPLPTHSMYVLSLRPCWMWMVSSWILHPTSIKYGKNLWSFCTVLYNPSERRVEASKNSLHFIQNSVPYAFQPISQFINQTAKSLFHVIQNSTSLTQAGIKGEKTKKKYKKRM